MQRRLPKHKTNIQLNFIKHFQNKQKKADALINKYQPSPIEGKQKILYATGDIRHKT
jgi:hypothetical protein